MSTPETVLVGDVTVLLVEDLQTAISHAAPGTTVVVAPGEPQESLRELSRYGAVVVTQDGHVERPHV